MHPRVYDNMKYGYSRQDVASKAWKEFANKVNDTGK
jgi:hypothetical protein